jgi:hypothetical protein
LLHTLPFVYICRYTYLLTKPVHTAAFLVMHGLLGDDEIRKKDQHKPRKEDGRETKDVDDHTTQQRKLTTAERGNKAGRCGDA